MAKCPLVDRQDGRSSRGYSCNLKLLGRYQGEGSSWVSQSYGKCAYMSTRWPNTEKSPGVQVLDVSDPRHPHLVGTLTSAAMLSPWESLKVNAALWPAATSTPGSACSTSATPRAPREIAYYVPPAQLGENDQLRGSEHAGGVAMVALNDVDNGGDIGQPRGQIATGPPILNVDWCSSPPAFVGSDELRVTCQDNGFMVLRFTNHAHVSPERGTRFVSRRVR